MTPLPIEIVYFWGVIIAMCVVALAIVMGIAAHRNKIERKQEEEAKAVRHYREVASVIARNPLPKTLTREYIEKANADLERMQGRNK